MDAFARDATEHLRVPGPESRSSSNHSLLTRSWCTGALPVSRYKRLDAILECTESAELRMALKMLPRLRTERERHVLVLIPHPNIYADAAYSEPK